MGKIKGLLTIVILMAATVGCLHTFRAQVTELFVSPTGSDDNPGTFSKPLKTLDVAQKKARQGNDVVVVLRGGTYRLDKPLLFGAEDSGQYWKAYGNETPVISGGVPVTGWTPDAAGRFKAQVALDNFRQLWVNGQRAKRARGAVPAGLAFWGQHKATVRKEANPPGLTGSPGFLPGTLEGFAPAGYTAPDMKLAEWKNPSDMEIGYYTSWTHMIAKVEAITLTNNGVVIEMSQPGFYLSSLKGGARAKQPAYMENALELLNESGEWYFDRVAHTLYYLPRPGEDLSKVEVVVPKLEKLVVIKGTLETPVRNLKLTGITFAHATWLAPSTACGHPDGQANFTQPVDNGFFRPEHERGWVAVNGEYVKSPAAVVVDAGHGIRFDDCTFTAMGGAGLDLQNGAQSNVVCGCLFYDISGSGIQVGDVTREDHHPSDVRRIVKDNQILNNLITRVGAEYTDAIGIFYGYTEGTVIAHNEIVSVPYTGISGGWGWGMPDAGGGRYAGPVIFKTPTTCKNNRIEFNHIHDVMKVRHDGGGIYTLSRQPGTVIRGNHIYDSHAPFGGIYLDEGSGGIEVTSNLVYRAFTPVFRHTCGRDAENNIHDNVTTPPAQTVPGVKGWALGRGSGLTVPGNPKYALPKFTLMGWIRLSNYPGGTETRRWIFCQGANEHANGNISLIVDGQGVGGYLNCGGGFGNCHAAKGGGAPVVLNQWTPVALTYDGDTLRVYCHGNESAATKIGKAHVPCNAPLTFGGRSDQFSTFDCGDLDEFRLYNRALSPAELQSPPRDGLVQQWDFDASAGETAARRIVDQAGLEPRYRGLLKKLAL